MDLFEPTMSSFLDESFSNFKSKEERKKKRTQRKEKRAAKKTRRIEKRKIAKEERKNMTLAQKLLNLSQKANPAAVVPRSSFLLALRVNLFGISRRLYPATLTDEEIKKKGLDPENAKRAKDVIENKFAKVWLGLGGRKISLYENIKKGFDKPIFKTKKIKEAKKKIKEAEENSSKKSSFDGGNTLYNPLGVQGTLYQMYAVKPIVEPFHNFDANDIDLGIDGTGSMDLSEMRSNKDCRACSSADGSLSKHIDSIESGEYSNGAGYDDAAVAAYISAGLSIMGGLVKMVNSAGVSKNPYKQGTADYKEAEKDNQEAAKEGDTTPPPVNEEELNKIKEAAASDAKKGITTEESAKDEEAVSKEAEKELGVDDKILGVDKTLFWTGVVVLGLGAGLLIYKMKGRSASVATT